MPERIIQLAKEMSNLAQRSVTDIQSVTNMTRVLSLNAMIEAARAGDAGKGFGVVAREVRQVSDKINTIAGGLGTTLVDRAEELDRVGKGLIGHVRGTRLTDLALNMIEIIDRNLYERSCDVRWWATDSAVVDVATQTTRDNQSFACDRLRVILDSYTVYLDIWVCDLQGRVIANGRPGKYAVASHGVGGEHWYRQALSSHDGSEFSVSDIHICPVLANRSVATYSAAIRAGGQANAKPVGVLGIFFDWQAQSQTVVDSVRLTEDEKDRTRCMLLDSKQRVIASSDRCGILSEILTLNTNQQPRGNYIDNTGTLVGYALTPGYETYSGLGWYGVISQSPAASTAVRAAA